MTPTERSWGRSILVPSADPVVKTGRGMGGGRGEGLQYRLTKIHRDHRGHRGSHYNVTYAPYAPYAPRLCAAITCGPRSTWLSPIFRPPLAGSGQNHRHACLWLVDASTAYPRSWTSAFQGCQAGASIANPVFHAPFARISLAWRVFSADTVEASLACFMWCSL